VATESYQWKGPQQIWKLSSSGKCHPVETDDMFPPFVLSLAFLLHGRFTR
jgi:hypothetical protein